MINKFIYFLCILIILQLSALASEDDKLEKGKEKLEYNNQIIQSSSVPKSIQRLSAPKSILPLVIMDEYNQSIESVEYIGVNTRVPAQYIVVDPYSDGFNDYMKNIHDAMTASMGKELERKKQKKLKKDNTNNKDKTKEIEDEFSLIDDEEVPASAFFYSEQYNIQLFVASDITYYQFYPDYFNKIVKVKDPQKQHLVNIFFNDLAFMLKSPCYPVPNIRECFNYLDPKMINNTPEKKPLKLITKIYKDNKLLFEEIIRQKKRSDNILNDIEDSIEADIYATKEIKEHKKQKALAAYNSNCYGIYSKLVEQKIFNAIIKKEYRKNVTAHMKIFQVIKEWYGLCRSCLATCYVGSWDGGQYGREFYKRIVFPFLEGLLMDKNTHYFNINTIFEDEFGDGFTRKRFDVIKFKAIDSRQIPAIALCGFEINKNQKTSPKGEKEESGPAQKNEKSNACLIM